MEFKNTQLTPHKSSRKTPLYLLMEDFLEHLEVEKNRSPLTTRNYKLYLEKFFSWGQKEFPPFQKPEDINKEAVRQFRRYLSRLKNQEGDYLSPNTLNYYLIAIRSFLKYLSSRDIKSLAPEKIDLAKPKEREISFLEGKELEIFLNAPLQTKESDIIRFRDKAILELLFSTGLRVSELTNLKIENINLEKDEFQVKGKGGKWRIVFLSNQAKYWLKKYLEMRKDVHPELFIRLDKAGKNEETFGLTPRSVQRIVKKYAKIAGITKKLTTHSLRHSFATDLLNAGANIREVQKMLGHSSLATTQIYTHVTDTHLKKVYQTFHDKHRKGDSPLFPTSANPHQ